MPEANTADQSLRAERDNSPQPAQILPVNSTSHTARVLGRSRSWLFQEWKEGRGPRRRLLGKFPVVLEDDLRAYLDALPNAD